MIIEGLKIKQELIDKLKTYPVPKKYLAAFIVAGDKIQENFLSQKEKVAKELNIDFRIYRLSPDITNDEFRKKIHQIVDRKKCGGAIVQLPLPNNLNADYILNAIPPTKDIDLLSERSIGGFYNNRSLILPPSVEVVKEILKRTNFSLAGKNIAIVGLGKLVGKPISLWLINNAKIEKIKNIFILDKESELDFLKLADLVILGANQGSIVTPNNLKAKAGIIDFGYSYNSAGKLIGNLDIANLKPNNFSFYTPTPGGTGPILIAKIFENFYALNNQ